MSTDVGAFVWYDVMTTDTKAAEAFYQAVLGWSAADAGMGGDGYTIFSAGANMVAGLMLLPDEARAAGIPPAWSGYVAVDDVDAYAIRVQTAGGAICRPPEDIPGVGRFAVVADPYGAVFLLFRGNGDQAPAPAAPGTPGHVGWHELQAGDLDGAFAFYAGLFGWTKADAMDMGALGIYQIFAVAGVPCGGMMTRLPEVPRPFWLYYFNVEAIDAAAERVQSAGGSVIHGPQEVPGGMWIIQCLDPQGAMFAMVAPSR
jgi:predicted enzyme related to lactoylglutathione lyase